MNDRTAGAAPLTFADLMTEEIIFYDPEFHEECVTFCRDRGIHHLPSLDNDERHWVMGQDGNCGVEAVPDDLVVQASGSPFHLSFEDRFRRRHLHFVHSDQRLVGVVHFSDYNAPVVSQYLYGAMAEYERSLRALLINRDLADKDMLAWFADKASNGNDHFTKRHDRLSRVLNRDAPGSAPFELCYLDDLIGLLRDREVIGLKHEVVELRNHVMHAHELVDRRGGEGSHLFDFASFQRFFRQVQVLLTDHHRVKNRLGFLEKTADGPGG